jgi:hypothetical protein
MKINARIKKIEKELQDQINIPYSARIIVTWPNDTEAEKELKLKSLYEELKQKYGEDVSREDIIFLRIVYDEPASSGADELNQGVLK